MARRYGGKYSPDSADGTQPAPPRGQFDGARVDPVGARTNLLFVPPVVLVFTSLSGGAVNLTLGLTAAGLLALAAWLLREGLRAEAAYQARKVARRPAFPRKMAASLLTGIGVAVAAYRTEPGLLAPLLFGGVATVLHGLAFGIDPLRDKGMDRRRQLPAEPRCARGGRGRKLSRRDARRDRARRRPPGRGAGRALPGHRPRP